MKFEIEVSELKEIINDLGTPDQLFKALRHEIKGKVGDWLSELMKAELDVFLKREKYGRVGEGEERNYRNGYYERRITLKGVGEVAAKVPRDRNGEYGTGILPRFKRYETALREELSLMFLSGMSTRNLSMLSKRLVGRRISPSEISRCNGELIEAVEKWRVRDLSKEKIKYLFIDGVNFRMRIEGSVELVPILVVIGVSESNHKLILSMQSGDKESASRWREVFRDLKGRGLRGDVIQLGIMDGLSGLETAFKEEFVKAAVQRCQVHVARNVLSKVPVKSKEKVADHIRNIFYASSRRKALGFFKDFEVKYGKIFPSALKSLTNSLESCLSYLKFPEEEWINLRTTNCIERVNKEFKRRTNSMEIVGGESSCYCLLAFISFKMELHWRGSPIGRSSNRNLNFMKKIKGL